MICNIERWSQNGSVVADIIDGVQGGEGMLCLDGKGII